MYCFCDMQILRRNSIRLMPQYKAQTFACPNQLFLLSSMWIPLRQYRTELVVQMRSQIFRQIV